MSMKKSKSGSNHHLVKKPLIREVFCKKCNRICIRREVSLLPTKCHCSHYRRTHTKRFKFKSETEVFVRQEKKPRIFKEADKREEVWEVDLGPDHGGIVSGLTLIKLAAMQFNREIDLKTPVKYKEEIAFAPLESYYVASMQLGLIDADEGDHSDVSIGARALVYGEEEAIRLTGKQGPGNEHDKASAGMMVNQSKATRLREEKRQTTKRPSILASITEARKYATQRVEVERARQVTMIAGKPLEKVIHLPRGGFYVKSDIGPIQFGIPPETIKDSMLLGLPLPSHYVIPKTRFNLKMGMNQAEFEFPAYFTFFVKRRKLSLICAPEAETFIRTIFRETLLGPEKVELPERFSTAIPKDVYPDLEKEMASFRINPFTKEPLTVDTLLEFTHFDANGVANVKGEDGKMVEILDVGDEYTVFQGLTPEASSTPRRIPETVEEVPDTPPSTNTDPSKHKKSEPSDSLSAPSPSSTTTSISSSPPSSSSKPPRHESNRSFSNNSDSESETCSPTGSGLQEYCRVSAFVFLGTPIHQVHSEHVAEAEAEVPPPPVLKEGKDSFKRFVPPYFGITMLGNSDGFDAKGSTTGFVIWMNRRGIMVDPPPHSGALLRKVGINPRLMRGVVLTHCHADHDAGTFQKILEEGRVVLMTTPVILNSFLRKYNAISGLDIAILRKLFSFRPVLVGEDMKVYGGHLNFFYSLHSIPCVGVRAYCNGKSMIYSADTLNDPVRLDELHAAGVLSKGRRDALVNFEWHHDVILHECGVPPIHTPLTTLQALPDDVKEKLYIVHKPASTIPPGVGLKSALVGPDNSIIISNEPGEHFRAMEILDLVGSIEVFSRLPVDRGAEMISCSEKVVYPEGGVLIQEGTFGSEMFVVGMGKVWVGVNGKFIKYLTVGDHFGAMGIISGAKRTASIIAATEVEVYVYTKEHFEYIVRHSDAVDRLEKLGKMQRSASWQTMEDNSFLVNLTSAQKTHLQSILHTRQCAQGEKVWHKKSPEIAVLVESGQFVFSGARDMTPFVRGAFVGDMKAFLSGNSVSTELECLEAGSVYYVNKVDLMDFIDHNPGLFIFFMNRRFVE
eukprot:gb/GEZN01000795.1/.p1 GENE.gb/GEZN01000795.1/~~gb/GEZN01000795.1/.p1  ORF type:complete len:1074 (-),score=181.42 gb/GEZN01000795.1/:218-3439(-)